MSKTLITLIAVALVLVVTGCGASGNERAATRIAENGDRINQADIDFATDLIVLNAQSLQLVDLIREHSTSGQLTEVGERILEDLSIQTEQLVSWLSDWGITIPETPLDHANGGHSDGEDHGGGMTLTGDEMPGILSSDQVDILEKLDGDAFDQKWIDLVVSQRQGAIKIANQVTRLGEFEPLLRVARTTAGEQRATIEILTAP